jgi:hypothetical protein
MLADQILKSGHRIIAEPRARTQHPAPNGLKHFVYRALCEGQDNAHFESAHRKSFTVLRHFKEVTSCELRGALPATTATLASTALAL